MSRRRSARHRAPLRLAALAVAVAACKDGPALQDPLAPRAAPKVEHAGVLRDLMEQGAAPGTIAVEPLLARPHFWALGPLANFGGELLVWDGTPFTSRVRDGRVVVSIEHGLSVPLLVGSRVTKWREVAIPDEARELAAFEAWLPDAARGIGLDETLPFAFQIVGSVERATLHVVARTPIELGAAPIQALGFHATDAKGIWTHHDRDVHVHLRTLFGSTMGHVDDFTLAPGALVRLAWR